MDGTLTPFRTSPTADPPGLEHWDRIPSYQPPETPPWDRTVDIVCHRYQHDQVVPTTDLDQVLNAAAFDIVFPEHLPVQRISNEGGKRKGYNDLPPSVRRRICVYLVKPQLVPVTLSHLAFTRAAWSLQSLVPFHQAYEPVKKLLVVSPLMRIDVLLTFLSVNAFHVTLSPHVGPRISPLATEWLIKYGAWMEKMIIEVDMTKLGLGAAEGAGMLYPGLRNVQKLVQDVARSQEDRVLPLRELTLLCRRYYGERPGPESNRSSHTSSASGNTSGTSGTNSSDANSAASTHTAQHSKISHENSNPTHSFGSSFDSSDTRSLTPPPLNIVKSPTQPRFKAYYCPNYHLPLLNALYTPLHSKTHALRMCGFSERYSHALIKAMFPAGEGRCVFRLGPSNGAWPRLVGQRSWLDDGTGDVMIDVVEEDDTPPTFVWIGADMPPRPVRGENGGLSLPSAERKRLDRGSKSTTSGRTASVASSGKTLRRGTRLKKFLAGAGAKADSVRDSGSSKDSKEGRMALMSELPGYI